MLIFNENTQMIERSLNSDKNAFDRKAIAVALELFSNTASTEQSRNKKDT
jgi:hypothetical protein